MLNGKVCINSQGQLELPLFKGEGTWRGAQAGSLPPEANWQSLWKDASRVFSSPAQSIDFNTNGDLNWTSSGLQTFPSLVWEAMGLAFGRVWAVPCDGITSSPSVLLACHRGAPQSFLFPLLHMKASSW